MANYFTFVTALTLVPTSRSEHDELMNLLRAGDLQDEHGFDGEWHEGGSYFFAEESGVPEALPATFRAALGRCAARAGMPYIEFSYANACSYARPGSAGGGAFRMGTNGALVFAELTWPASPLHLPASSSDRL